MQKGQRNRGVAEYPFEVKRKSAGTFRWSDAWVLLSVVCAAEQSQNRDFARIEDVIACGDAINHAIFNYDELNGGLNRLTDAGEVLRSGDLFGPSPSLHEFWTLPRKQKFTGFEGELQLLRERIGAPDWSPAMPNASGIATEFISISTFKAAVDAYKGRNVLR